MDMSRTTRPWGSRSRHLLTATAISCLASMGGVCYAGQVGYFTLKAKGKSAAQTASQFVPVAGRIVHLRSDDKSSAVAELNFAAPGIGSELSWWVYLAAEPYDDFVLYDAQDSKGKPADVKIMLREDPQKMPESPDDWRGNVWIESGDGLRSVTYMARRPGWHRVAVRRASEKEVEVVLNGESAGTYPSRSGRPAARVLFGDASETDGAGEVFSTGWVSSLKGSVDEVEVSEWTLRATGKGTAEATTTPDDVGRASLYLRANGEARCGAEWGAVDMRIPYQFWCQVYVSDQPYRSFCVLNPLDKDQKPTDILVEFDDPAPAAEASAGQGFVWVTDADGRRSVGAVPRGVWHEFTVRRRATNGVDLLIDGKLVGTYRSRSTQAVASYRFGDFESTVASGEVYWYHIRLVRIPEE